MTQADGLTVAVVGATGAVGKDLLTVLERANLPIAAFRLFASPASNGVTIEVRERSHRVQALPSSDGIPAVFEGVDLVFLAAPANVSRGLVPVLQDEDIPVVDIGGTHANASPMMVPSVSIEPIADFPDTRVMCSPSAPAVVIATVLSQLALRGVTQVRGTVMMSASSAGKAGAEELSGQVVSLFNGKTPPRVVFPQGLAFDLHSQVGDDVEGWTSVERRIAVEVADLLGWRPEQALMSAVLAPMFAGVAASLTVDFDHGIDLDAVRALLEDTPGVRIGDPVPGPRRVAGDSAIYVGRIRLDPDNSRLHLWVTADNLRVGASANALAIATALWSEGYL
ncbi:MAG: Asd/ArgC dimerization domain-containing protein [Myxococcota bacterium]|nr:Asd/ArgC dimerization domain-containing protein [Myxococcota bacterium]